MRTGVGIVVGMFMGIFIAWIWSSTPASAVIESSAVDAIAQDSYDQRKGAIDMANKASAAKGATLDSLSKACGVRPIRVGAVLSGQAPAEKKTQACLETQLGLSSGSLAPLAGGPARWNVGGIYRMHEAIDVYGPAMQRWMVEHFGDAIMSAISFTIDMEEGTHPKYGKTIKVIMEGKMLNYSPDEVWANK